MSEIEDKTNLDNQPKTEVKEADIVEKIENIPMEKPRKPRTEKQIEAFNTMQIKRANNVANRKIEADLKKQEKKAKPVESVVEPVLSVEPLPEPKKEHKPKREPKYEDSSDSEEELIIRKKPKKPRKKVIVEVSDSESESEHEPEQKRKAEPPKEHFQSQRNKKYSKPPNTPNTAFFCE